MGFMADIFEGDQKLALESARHWHGLAEYELRMAEHELRVFPPGHSVEVKYIRAKQFRGMAATIMLEEMTGEQWCFCNDQLQLARLCQSPIAKKQREYSLRHW